MFFNAPPRQKGILLIDDDFATLTKVTGAEDSSGGSDLSSQDMENEMHFIFSYRISQLKALEENALSVVITVKTKNKTRPVLLQDFQNKKDIASRIVTHRSNIANANVGIVVAKVNSDITSKIDNQLVQSIKNNLPLEESGLLKRKLLLRRIKDVKEKGLGQHVLRPKSGFFFKRFGINLTKNSKKGEIFRPFTKELFNNLLKKELAPSDIVLEQDRFISSHELSKGILRERKKESYDASDPYSELLDLYLYDSQEDPKNLSQRPDDDIVTTFEQVSDSIITMNSLIKIKTNIAKKNPQLIVKFDLIKKDIGESNIPSSYVLESVEKNINLLEHVTKKYRILRPPIVKKNNDAHKISLTLQQLDENANLVEIYKKSINETNYSNFEKIDEVQISKKDGSKTIQYNNLQDEYSIFRVVARSDNNRDLFCNEFTDVVVCNKRKKTKRLIIVPYLVSGGVKIKAYNKDPSIKMARLLARDITLKNSNYSETGVMFYFSDKQTVQEAIVGNLKHNHIYEFATMLVSKEGEQILSSDKAIIEALSYEGNALSITLRESSANARNNLQNLNTGTDNAAPVNDFTFSVNALLQTDQIGQTINVSAQTSALYNLANLQNKNAIYDKYIFFMITRYNTTNGEVANLGIIGNNELVSDSEQSRKFLAEKMLPGNDYLFVIQPLVREPETVTEEIVDAKDSITKKDYRKNTRKYLHPSALKKSIILSENYMDFDTKHLALYGKLGINYVMEISKKSPKPQVTNLSVNLEKGGCVISWSISGDVNGFDHFMIMKLNEGYRKIIGKAHCLESKVVRFVHKLSLNDVGVNSYVIMPVYSNFEVGPSIHTEKVLVEELDVIV